jgi:hypothetical protein
MSGLEGAFFLLVTLVSISMSNKWLWRNSHRYACDIYLLMVIHLINPKTLPQPLNHITRNRKRYDREQIEREQ